VNEERARAVLLQAGIDALVVARPENARYPKSYPFRRALRALVPRISALRWPTSTPRSARGWPLARPLPACRRSWSPSGPNQGRPPRKHPRSWWPDHRAASAAPGRL